MLSRWTRLSVPPEVEDDLISEGGVLSTTLEGWQQPSDPFFSAGPFIPPTFTPPTTEAWRFETPPAVVPLPSQPPVIELRRPTAPIL